MIWLLLALPIFFATLLALVAIRNKLVPPPPPVPDAVGLRSVARFTYESGDPAGLMDAIGEALESAGVETSPWRWDRDGAYIECGVGTARYQLDLYVYGETSVFLSGVGTAGAMMGPPPDGEVTRRILRAVDGALRAHPSVRDLRWRRREIDAAGGEGQHSSPFDDG
ncbi:MAG: hypothetical protein OHK0013_09830 [Sandaracinaceae bacterium]